MKHNLQLADVSLEMKQKQTEDSEGVPGRLHRSKLSSRDQIHWPVEVSILLPLWIILLRHAIGLNLRPFPQLLVGLREQP